jgi:AP-1 complex subunit gamma-1
MNEAAVVSLVEAALGLPGSRAGVREFALTAAMKLTARMPGQVVRLRQLVARYQGSVALEVQQRSCEFGRIFAHEPIRPALLERMPAPDESEYHRVYGGAPVTPTHAGASAAAVAASDALAAAAGGASAGGAASDLVDLLGGVDAAAAAVRTTSGAPVAQSPGRAALQAPRSAHGMQARVLALAGGARCGVASMAMMCG